MRFAAYAGTSTVLATAVIIRALHQRANFYSASVYLAQSSACLMILTNLVLLGVCGVLLGLQKLLYGPLRPIEIEQLYEKAWFAVTETCLAMTIFREELGAWFVVMFVSLLVGKVWGWIGEGRLEILEQQPPANPRLFHTRLSISLVLSIAFEMYMLNYSIQTVRRQARPNMMVMFAFEFAVLTVTSISAFTRYIISLYETAVIKSQTNIRLEERRQQIRREREEAARAAEPSAENPVVDTTPIDDELEELDIDVPGWEEKGRWVFYLDLATDFFKLILYIAFFSVLCMFYGMPIHIIRDVALTIRSFYKRINDFLRYRHATRDMNERYPDATAGEIRNEDVCIICREGMRAWSDGREQPEPAADGALPAVDPHRATDERLRPKKLPCGHILHFACLRSWLERQQNCPTCRRSVLVTPQTARPPLAQLPNGLVQGNGQANARNPGAPTQEANPQVGAEQNRIRVFNFGPFRVGFGAGHDIQGLAQHLNDQPQPENRQAPAPVGGVVPQLGFGLRFGRQAPTVPSSQAVARAGQNGVQAQLQHIEQQIMQEINTLRIQADQLNLVRAMQGELARLRIAQAHANASQNGGTAGDGQTRNPALALGNMPPVILPHRPTVHAFGASEQQQRLSAGDLGLPPGLTIPEGWSLLPLQRLPNNANLFQQPAAPPHDSMGWTRNNAFASETRAMPGTSNSNPGQTPTSQGFQTSNTPENGRANGMVPESSGSFGGHTSQSSNSGVQPNPTVQAQSSSSRSSRLPGSKREDEKPERQRADGPSVLLPRWGSRSTEEETKAGAQSVQPSSDAAFDWDSEGEATASKVEKGKGKATTVEDATEDIDRW
ncbi:E3 ubiquitin-protein ligase hrd1 [Trapelia coarctata]|nr:E3 ubiquitin-protein ligase hrd1 [Trapelia coarctata]